MTDRIPLTPHFARLARDLGADVVAVTGHPDSDLATLATHTIVLPVADGAQLGGTLFEQSSLLVLDALVAADSQAFEDMRAWHAKLY